MCTITTVSKSFSEYLTLHYVRPDRVRIALIRFSCKDKTSIIFNVFESKEILLSIMIGGNNFPKDRKPHFLRAPPCRAPAVPLPAGRPTSLSKIFYTSVTFLNARHHLIFMPIQIFIRGLILRKKIYSNIVISRCRSLFL